MLGEHPRRLYIEYLSYSNKQQFVLSLDKVFMQSDNGEICTPFLSEKKNCENYKDLNKKNFLAMI